MVCPIIGASIVSGHWFLVLGCWFLVLCTRYFIPGTLYSVLCSVFFVACSLIPAYSSCSKPISYFLIVSIHPTIEQSNIPPFQYSIIPIIPLLPISQSHLSK